MREGGYFVFRGWRRRRRDGVLRDIPPKMYKEGSPSFKLNKVLKLNISLKKIDLNLRLSIKPFTSAFTRTGTLQFLQFENMLTRLNNCAF